MLEILRECLYSVPGEFDVGLTTGGALELLSSVADDRLWVQLPAIAEPWDDRDGWLHVVGARFILFGPRGEAVVRAADALLQEVWRGSRPKSTLSVWPIQFPMDPPWEPGALLIPASGGVRYVTSPRGFTPETISRLRAIEALPGTRIVARFNEQAARAYRKQIRQWSDEQRSPEILSVSVRRWLGVAASLALWQTPERPTISADLLVAAEEIAITNHDLACSVLRQELVEKPGRLFH
jgi:hypothetical protein